MRDILVVSYPRSGTHFLMNTIFENFKDYDKPNLEPKKKYRILSETRPLDNIQEIEAERDLTDPLRVYKTHHAWPALAGAEKDLRRKWLIFHIEREPKDTLVSGFLFHKGRIPGMEFKTIREYMLFNPEETPELSKWIVAKNMVEHLMKHRATWEKVMWRKRFTYEELHGKFNEMVDRIAEILQVPSPKIKVRPDMSERSVFEPQQGKVGAWREYFTQDDEALFEELCRGI